MSAGTSIEWTDRTWNPVRGCSRVSPGCVNCYAERQAARFSDPGQYAHGFVTRTASGPRWTGRVELVEDKLREPLSWRKPQRVFVNSMSDLGHEKLPWEAFVRVVAVMASCPHLTFQVLTKRADVLRDRMQRLAKSVTPLQDAARAMGHSFQWEHEGTTHNLLRWPIENLWLGVSVEDRERTVRIDALRDTPAALRFLSVEPLLEDIGGLDLRGIGWVIVGGESGPGARPCDVAWIRGVVDQCKAAHVPVFCKQLGARAVWNGSGLVANNPPGQHFADVIDGREMRVLALTDRKGGTMSEWPADLRVREFPKSVRALPEVPRGS